MAAKLLEVGLCSNESNINHYAFSRCKDKYCDAICIEEIHGSRTLAFSTFQDRRCKKYMTAKLREVGVCNAVPRYIHKYCDASVAIHVLNEDTTHIATHTSLHNTCKSLRRQRLVMCTGPLVTTIFFLTRPHARKVVTKPLV